MKSLFNVKKHFAIFAIMATAMMLPNFAYAYNAKCNHESKKVKDGVCKCGAGVMYFYTKDNSKPGFGKFSDDAFGPGAKFVKVIEDGTNPKRFAIICEAPITKIPTGMFRDSDKLCSIDIPNSVTTIEMNAFNNCDALTAVVIPENVKTIGPWAFNDCDALTSIVIPESVKEIKMEAFRGCDKLTSVEVKGENTVIDNTSFSGSTNIQNVSGTVPQIEVITGGNTTGNTPSGSSQGGGTQTTPPNDIVSSLNIELLTDASSVELKSKYPNAEITFKTYERPNVGTWGTLCLPFAVSSDKNIQYYQLSSVNLETGVMEFEEQSYVEEGTPWYSRSLQTSLLFRFPPQSL